MKKLFFVAMALLALSSCKKPKAADDVDSVDLSPIARQWTYVSDTPESSPEIIDFSLQGGKMTYVSNSWQDYPDATYLVHSGNVAPYTGQKVNDEYHLEVKESWGTVKYVFSAVTDKSAKLRIKSADYPEYGGTLTLPEKVVKVAESPLFYIGFEKGFRTQGLSGLPSSLEAFKKLAGKGSLPLVLLDAEGKPEDYEGKDISGKIVSVLHPHYLDGPIDYSVSQKVATAAAKGAVAIVINVKTSYPLSMEEYNEFPVGKEEIPVAIWHYTGAGLSTPVDGGTYKLNIQ